MKKILLLTVLASFLLVNNAMSTPVNLSGSEKNLQTIFDEMTQGGKSSIDVEKNQVGYDAVWQLADSGMGSAIMIIELAGNMNSNTFGIYDINTQNKIELFNGAANSGHKVSFSYNNNEIGVFDWATKNYTSYTAFSTYSFGFYMGTANNGTFYSDTNYNEDSQDHMIAYRGVGDYIRNPSSSGADYTQWTPGAYILAWEDLYGLGDWDYNDMVVLVESVQPAPVPEPATMFLLGSGLLGLAGFGRKKLFKKG